jgi:hypothetical protein
MFQQQSKDPWDNTWGWLEQQTTSAQPMMPSAPLGGGEQAPQAIRGAPDPLEQIAKQVGTSVATDMAKDVAKEYVKPQVAKGMEYLFGQGASQAATQGASQTAGQAGASAASSAAGPLAAGVPDLMQGKYGNAALKAGAAAVGGAVAGPFGAFAAPMILSLFGAQKGMSNVTGYSEGTGIVSAPGNGLVNQEAYYAANPDVAASGMSAQEHWDTYGQTEGRNVGHTTNAAGIKGPGLTPNDGSPAVFGGNKGPGVANNNPVMPYRNMLAAGFSPGDSEGSAQNVFTFPPDGFKPVNSQSKGDTTKETKSAGGSGNGQVNFGGSGNSDPGGQGISSDSIQASLDAMALSENPVISALFPAVAAALGVAGRMGADKQIDGLSAAGDKLGNVGSPTNPGPGGLPGMGTISDADGNVRSISTPSMISAADKAMFGGGGSVSGGGKNSDGSSGPGDSSGRSSGGGYGADGWASGGILSKQYLQRNRR